MLMAAPTLACVPIALPVGLMRVGSQGRFAVAVGAAHRLVFDALPKETSAMVDLSQITRLLIIRVAGTPAAEAGH